MTVACSNKTHAADVSTNTNLTTASVAFTSGNLYLLSLRCDLNSTVWSTATWTIGGTGSWTEVTRVTDADDSSRGSILFRYLPGSSPTGVVNIGVGSGNASTWVWNIDEVSGEDTGGSNGANAIVQSATAALSLGASSPITATLGAFSDANNATYGVFHWGGTDMTQGTGFTSVGFEAVTTSNGCRSEFKTANDTTVDMTFTGTGTVATGIGVEIKSATVTPPEDPPANRRNIIWPSRAAIKAAGW